MKRRERGREEEEDKRGQRLREVEVKEKKLCGSRVLQK
jgi:hypothetical protein